jgi:uncharacterized protein YjbI with pentapeptide repeats
MNSVVFLNSDLRWAHFLGAELEESKFKDVFLPESNFRRANLEGAIFLGSTLRDSEFCEANLTKTVYKRSNLATADFNDSNLNNANFIRSFLSQSNFTDAIINDTEFNNTDLCQTEFSESILTEASFIHSGLDGANFSDANLENSQFVDAGLRDVNLERSCLIGTLFKDVDMRGIKLARADIRNFDFSNINLNQDSRVGNVCKKPRCPTGYDNLAQAYHIMKTEFSGQGIEARARQARFNERAARTDEAFLRNQYGLYIRDLLSRYLTGYGLRTSYVISWSLALISLSALWFLIPISSSEWKGGWLYYSVVTFVTSPPEPPNISEGFFGIVTTIVVLVEAYFGTVLIILLGYVLSNRDRI